MKAKVLSILCRKGGTAKTTTTINFAVEAVSAVSRGLEVAVIDPDPQVSACDWKDLRGDKPPVVAATPVPHLEQAIKAASDAGADLIIVDTADRTNEAASAAARVADLVLIALQPSLIDLKTRRWKLSDSLETSPRGHSLPASDRQAAATRRLQAG